MAVFTSFRGRHLYNLARSMFHDDEAILTQRGALGWVGIGGSSITSLKIFISHTVETKNKTSILMGDRNTPNSKMVVKMSPYV